jgi:plasmanylethanolamine desaturase
LLLLTASMPLTSHAWLCLQAVLLFTALAALITNECHKWAHAEAADTPPLIRWAQRYRLVLSPEHHRLHHTAPFNSHFCMANGWLNAPLNACLRAWR